MLCRASEEVLHPVGSMVADPRIGARRVLQGWIPDSKELGYILAEEVAHYRGSHCLVTRWMNGRA